MTDSAKAPSKGAWTGGEWKVRLRDDSEPVVLLGANYWLLIDSPYGIRNRPEREANALLISKAPQMAELLNAELDSLDDWLRDESVSDKIKGEMLLREDEIQKLLKQILTY